MAGTAERSAKSCGDVRRREAGDPASRRAPSRVSASGAPARASKAIGSPAGVTSRSSLRSIGASNDWKKKRSTRKPGANASDGACVSSSSHSM